MRGTRERQVIKDRHADQLLRAEDRATSSGGAGEGAQKSAYLAAEPGPSLVVALSRHRSYFSDEAMPGDLTLIIEAADTSRVADRTLQLTLYAAAGIPEDWIVHVASGRAEVYRCPAAADYRDRPMVGRDGTIAAGVFSRPDPSPAKRAGGEDVRHQMSSGTPAFLRSAMASACACFMAASAGICFVATTSMALLILSPTCGNTGTVRYFM